MSEYKRLTDEELNDFTSRVVVQLEPTLTQQVMSLILELTEYRTKIEDGTLVFRKKPKKKYYAIVGYRNHYGKFGWNIHHVSIEYEKEYNRVALNIDGRLFVTTKDLLFNTKAEAKAKLKELEGEVCTNIT